MFTLIPPPLPDESLYSLLCRAYIIDAGFTHRKNLKRIFDPMIEASDLEMIGSQFYWFWQTCLKDYWSFPKTIMETTLFRLYSPMLLLSNRKHIVKWIGRDPLSIRLIMEQFFYVLSLDLYYLKFCPECIKADIHRHGVTYWHRSHCCRYAYACHRHLCKLEPIGTIQNGGECFLLPEYLNTATGKQTKLLVEDQIYQQLNNSENIYASREALQQFLNKDDNATELIQNEISQRFTLSDLKMLAIRYQFADGAIRKWVWEAVYAGKKLHIPELLAIRLLILST